MINTRENCLGVAGQVAAGAAEVGQSIPSSHLSLCSHPEPLISCRIGYGCRELTGLLGLWWVWGTRGGSKVFLGLSVVDTTRAAYGRPGPLQALILATSFSVSPDLGVYVQVN